ncbi:unnamed protein product [Fusarium equiseti]|uniref:Transcription factor domain-containing protein n=1 Tax=Fusarium equiseti TaxID=61235 RepID=A0A8J2N9Y6_FUSEQ|nr:unnamed protein product [Fusarium equiseti]
MGEETSVRCSICSAKFAKQANLAKTQTNDNSNANSALKASIVGKFTSPAAISPQLTLLVTPCFDIGEHAKSVSNLAHRLPFYDQVNEAEGATPANDVLKRRRNVPDPTAGIDTASCYDIEIAPPHYMEAKSQEIISSILSATNLSRKPDFSSTQSSCAQFFSPPNIESLLDVFFQIWYPNWPVFHKPTFCATQRLPQLTAALSLIGACLSPEPDDQRQAIECMDVVEEWIFSSLELCEDAVHEPPQVRERLDLLQAAYALVLLMNWEGSKVQTTRARRRYFSEIVSVARGLYPFAMAQPGTTDAWMDFALREECIRTLLYIFLLDCAFVIFHNSVPRMVISELRFRLASSEELFLAPDPEAWAALQPNVHIQRSTLYQAIDMMMTGEIGPEQWKVFENMSLLNVFTIISAFHNLIFHHHGPTKSSTITRGLRNWFHVWSSRDFSILEDRPKNDKIGFYCHAAEYWCLAILFCRQHELGLDGQGVDVPRMANETSDMSGLHSLITRFQGQEGLLAMR